MAKPADYYAILGVSKDATDKAIKVAYRNLAKRLHPDAGGDAAKFKALNEAADVLTDPTRRAAYDYEQKNGGASSGSPRRSTSASRAAEAEPQKPPPKATVALCEFCGTMNRVKGDPRYYPAACGKCGHTLGTRPPAGGVPNRDPFLNVETDNTKPLTQARCPHCQKRNGVVGPQGRPMTCSACGKEYLPGTGEIEGGLGQVMGDLANSLFGASASGTVRGMRYAEDKLREMADELRRRREELEKRK